MDEKKLFTFEERKEWNKISPSFALFDKAFLPFSIATEADQPKVAKLALNKSILFIYISL